MMAVAPENQNIYLFHTDVIFFPLRWFFENWSVE